MARRFQNNLISIENDITSEIKREYRLVRLEMIAALADLGGRSPNLLTEIRNILLNFKVRVNNIVQRFRLTIRDVMDAFSTRQVEAMRIDDNVGELITETSNEQEQILNTISTRLQEKVDVIQLNIIASLTNMVQSGEDDNAITRRLFALQPVDGRVSEWRNGRNSLLQELQEVLFATAITGTALIFFALGDRLREREPGVRMFKTAVATLDRRTTETCQRVDGQFQVITDPFVLTGSPRFSNQKQYPPFHHNCRTVVEFQLGRREPGDLRRRR